MAAEKTLTVLADLTPSAASANQGTARGQALLGESLATCGVGRTIVVDKAGVVIAGHKLLAAAQARNIPIDVVRADGQQLVVVQRTDLDLTEDPKARQLAYYDNRVSELDLSWKADQVQADLLAGVDVGAAFLPVELDVFTAQVDAARRAMDRAPDPQAPPPPSLDRDTLADAAEAVAEPTSAPAPDGPDEAAASEAARRLRVTDTLVFDNYDQQATFTQFMRRVRAKTPGHTTGGARLVAFIEMVEPG